MALQFYEGMNVDMDLEWVIDENNERTTIKKIFADLYRAFDNANTHDVEFILDTHGQTLLDDKFGYHGNGVAHLSAMFEYDCFDWIIKSGGDLNQRSSLIGYSPLMIAVVNNSQSMVNTLLGHSVNLEIVDTEGQTALHLAIIYNRVEIAKQLILKQNCLNVTSQSGLTPLHLAVIHNQTSTVKLLIDHGALLNVLDNKTRTPLHYACERGFLLNTVTLMENGALHDNFDSTCHTPLLYAIKSGHDDIVRFLISSNVDVNLRGVLRKQPIHAAAKSANSSILATVIAAGADVNSLDDTDNSPLAIAVANNKPDNVRLLLQNNAELNTPIHCRGSSHLNMSIIAVAMESNAVDIVTSLLFEGYKITSDDKTNLVNFIDQNVNDHELKTILLDMTMNPACLKRICRRVIRGTLTAVTLNKLDKLQVPTVILQYISHVP